jgi:hypothetical protein
MKRIDTAAARAAFGHYKKALGVFFDALTEIDELRQLVSDACSELEDTGGSFALKRASEIRSAMESSNGR